MKNMNVLFVIFVFLAFYPVVEIEAQTNFEVSVERVIMTQGTVNDSSGLVTVGYDPGKDDAYLSLGAQDALGTAFAVILSNLYLPARTLSDTRQYISVPFQLALLARLAALFPQQLIIYVHLFRKPMDYPYDPSTHIDTQVVTVTDLTDNAQGAALTANHPAVLESNKISGTQKGDVLSEVYYYGCTMPNMDLNDSKFPATADYAGDLNACVPTATANSMLWLDKKFNLFYGFPPLEHDFLDSLSRYMKRESKQGTVTDKMIQGKLDFINKHHLPLDVKFQVKKDYIDADILSSDGKTTAKCMNTGNYPTWDFLKQALKESCDVEINYVAENSAGEKYAHSVVITGVEEYKRSGLRYLDFKHDKNQKLAGGTRQESTQIFEDNDGKLRIASRRNAYIRDIVVECPRSHESGIIDRHPLKSDDFILARNYPNPFNGSTTITFAIRQNAPVNLSVFDANGALFQSFALGQLDAGQHLFNWNAQNAPSGLYLVKISNGMHYVTLKVLLVK
jgi:hypothetical protein